MTAYDDGQRDVKIELLSTDMVQVKEDVRWIRETMAERSGERRVALWVASVGGGALATAVAFVARKLGIQFP